MCFWEEILKARKTPPSDKPPSSTASFREGQRVRERYASGGGECACTLYKSIVHCAREQYCAMTGGGSQTHLSNLLTALVISRQPPITQRSRAYDLISHSLSPCSLHSHSHAFLQQQALLLLLLLTTDPEVPGDGGAQWMQSRRRSTRALDCAKEGSVGRRVVYTRIRCALSVCSS